MARAPRRPLALLLLVLLATPFVTAQLTDLPNLSTATETTQDSDTATTATSAESTAESTGDATTTGETTAATTDATTTGDSSAKSTDASTSASSFETTGSTATTTGGGGAPVISDIPTIAGAGVPTMVVPFTADAPFMQHSNYPEGTVFIVIGAVLGFLGACVIAWRLLVAWSINRSVRKSAMASIRSSEKTGTSWGGNGGYNPIHKEAGSVMSLDALTSNGKPLKSHFKDEPSRATPPANLFFSPTAQARNDNGSRPISEMMNNRSSSYLPAGYYASTSAHPAGGAGTTTMGGNLAPYARHSTLGPSPPESPGLQPQSRGSGGYRAGSRDGLASTRNSYLDVSSSRPGPHSGIYSQPSSSSLMVGNGNNTRSEENLPGSRAPSAYLEDLFENHGHGPRERF